MGIGTDFVAKSLLWLFVVGFASLIPPLVLHALVLLANSRRSCRRLILMLKQNQTAQQNHPFTRSQLYTVPVYNFPELLSLLFGINVYHVMCFPGTDRPSLMHNIERTQTPKLSFLRLGPFSVFAVDPSFDRQQKPTDKKQASASHVLLRIRAFSSSNTCVCVYTASLERHPATRTSSSINSSFSTADRPRQAWI